MKKITPYGIVAFISLVIRNFLLPNPFECFGDLAILYNWVAEPFLIIIAFLLVNLVYVKGSAPIFGSILFLLVYSALVGVLWVFGIFSFAWWWILIIIIVFIGLVILTAFIFSKFFEADDEY